MSDEFVPYLKGDLDARQHRIYNLPDPVDNNEVATKAYVDAGGGGSQSGVSIVDYLFTEVSTAGVYTAPSLDLPESSYLIDVQWWPESEDDWAADTAVLDVVDSVLGTVVAAQDVKGESGFAPNSAAQLVQFAQPYVYSVLLNGADTEPATITTTITTTINTPPVTPGMVMRVRLIYISAPEASPAVFA